MDFQITDHILPEDRDAIERGLLAYNLPRLNGILPRDLGLYQRDPSGEIVAGLVGRTEGNWLIVKLLWVSEALRGQKVGGSLLDKAEAIARERGCRYAFLDTFSFQAPAFYEKRGYRTAFVLTDYPVRDKRYYLTKALYPCCACATE